MDYYETLGVNHTTQPDEIKKAYKKLASKHHPDKGGDEAEFKKIQAAYETLSDPQKKHEYDNPSPFRNQGGNPFNNQGNPFADMFGDIFQNGQRQQRQRPQNFNAETHIDVSLEDVYFGTTKRIDVGTGQLDIQVPRGVRDNTIYNIPGKAPIQDNNLPAGDLRVRLQISRHPTFGRDGPNLIGAIEIDYIQAIMGTTVTLDHISGKKLDVKVPPGSAPDSRLKLRGQGFIMANSGIVGDFLILIKVCPVENLEQRHQDLLRQIQQERKRNS